MPAARGRRQPVTLRDFLELGCESSSDGFRSYPRCRPCDDAAAGGVVLHSPARPLVEQAEPLRRSPSWSPSAFFFLPKSPGALARISSLSRSFSRRIRFWRRRDEYDDDLDDRDSCRFPSPLVSSCSASETSSEQEDIVIEVETSAAPVSEETSSISGADRDCTDDVPGAAGDGHDDEAVDGDPAVVVGRRNLETMEDRQHLSPVSVLDFPYDDDDEEERSDAGTCCSPSSSFQRHSCLQRNAGKKKAQHKIRRRIDGQTTTEASVDLEARFTTTSSESGESVVVDDAHGWCAHLPSDTDNEAAKSTAPRHDYEERQSIDERSEGQDDEYRLLARLLDDTAADSAAVDEVSEWLLLDFFAEGIGRLCSVVGTTTTARPLDDDGKVATAALVEQAVDWLRGAGPQWGVGDVMFSGESALKDMERSRRWMCVHEEQQDVAAEVEAFVMDGLVDELVTALLVARAATVDGARNETASCES